MTERELINNARAEITEQSGKDGSPLAIFIEEYVNQHLTSAEVARKVSGKNLPDLITKIKDRARSNAKNGVAMMSDEEVRQMTDEFYGLKAEARHEADTHQKVDILDLL